MAQPTTRQPTAAIPQASRGAISCPTCCGASRPLISVTIMGQKLALPVYCSPTALQRLFHHQGERAVAAAAAKFGTMFGVSSLGTVGLEELRKAHATPQVCQFYFHKDRGLGQRRRCRGHDADRGQYHGRLWYNSAVHG